MKIEKNGYVVTDRQTDLQIERVHEFLSKKAYWSLGIPREILERAIEGSMCFGVYKISTGVQVGFARVVTDKATFAWLCDVYIEEDHRKLGLSKFLMECVKSHPALQNLRRFCLTTKDAQGLYSGFGFEVTKTPDYWMEIKDNEIYQKLKAKTQ